MIANFKDWCKLNEDQVEPGQESDILIQDFNPFKGTKKPLGADGITTSMVMEILRLMKTDWKDQPGFLQAAQEIETSQKVNRKNRLTFGQALALALSTCQTDKTFNSKGYTGDFCSKIIDIKRSDSDNRFSDSW
jgi:hypothetical protein